MNASSVATGYAEDLDTREERKEEDWLTVFPKLVPVYIELGSIARHGTLRSGVCKFEGQRNVVSCRHIQVEGCGVECHTSPNESVHRSSHRPRIAWRVRQMISKALRMESAFVQWSSSLVNIILATKIACVVRESVPLSKEIPCVSRHVVGVACW